VRTVLTSLACLGVAGCVSIPRLDADGIAVSEIITRIKCELAESLPDVRGEYNPAKKFHWIKYWTAKVDLELETTETGLVNASARYDPVSNFTLGFGGSLKTEGYRSDSISFTLSVDELMELLHSKECELPRGLGLLGNLGLREWVSSALTPVENKLLKVGYHQVPGKTAQIVGPLERAAGSKEKERAIPVGFEKDRLNIKRKVEAAEAYTETARIAAVNAKRMALRRQTHETFVYARAAGDKADAAAAEIEAAKILIWQAKIKYEKLHEKNSDEEKALNPLSARLKDVGEQVSAAKDAAAAAWGLLPQDAPLDSISHTAKFTVTASVNATPNWTLDVIRGPGLSSPFASLQRQRIHELIVVLGAPLKAGGKELSEEQRRQLINAKINSRGLVLLQPN
jgi:hypothetical protein